MIALRHLLSAPVLVLGAAATGFAVWIASDTPSPATPPPPSPAPVDIERPPGPPSGIVLKILRPGTPRAFIERRMMVMPPPIHDRVDLSGSPPVCRVRYLIYLSHPVPQLEETLTDFVPGHYLVTLEFDGGADGQPLIRATAALAR